MPPRGRASEPASRGAARPQRAGLSPRRSRRRRPSRPRPRLPKRRGREPPPPPPGPTFEELILPASSVIGLQLETAVSSERARVEDRVEARVTRDVLADGRVAIPAGITRARLGDAGRARRQGEGARAPRRPVPHAGARRRQRAAAATEAIFREGESPAGDSAQKIGGAAVGGAILGAHPRRQEGRDRSAAPPARPAERPPSWRATATPPRFPPARSSPCGSRRPRPSRSSGANSRSSR